MTPIEELPAAVRRALAEDLGSEGDLTSTAVIPEAALGRGRLEARADGILAGVEAAGETFRQVDDRITVRWHREDGAVLTVGDIVAELDGPIRSLLAAERTALNFLGHLSGVATLTRAFVVAAGSSTTILDTRKTLPGLRTLQKAAVEAGGGANHRRGLWDAVLIKDNHLAHAAIDEAVERARSAAPDRLVEVECDTLEQVREAIGARPDRVLLDNMTPEQAEKAVGLLRAAGIESEVSGGITVDNVTAYAKAGADFISVGALTHSAPALDLSLALDPPEAT